MLQKNSITNGNQKANDKTNNRKIFDIEDSTNNFYMNFYM